MRKSTVFALLTALTLAITSGPVGAQVAVPAQPVFVNPISGVVSLNVGETPCLLVKYVGTTAGKPTVEAAAGGDLTFKIAGAVDTTTGCSAGTCPASGVFDLSTPHASIDTMGELVSLINTTGANWRAVLVSCLASDLTDNTIDTLAATDAAGPKGAAFLRDNAVASASSTFSAQVAAVPPGADTDIRFWTVGVPTNFKPNTNAFSGYQSFVQFVREKITSTGTIGLFAILGVTRTYDSRGQVSEQVRTIWSQTGAATTVESTFNANVGPLVGAPGEMLIVRQRTGTDLTASQLQISGYFVNRKQQ